MSTKPPAPVGAGILREHLDYQRDHSERCDGVAEADPVPSEKIGGDERRGESAEAEEEVDQVQRDATMGFAHIADQSIRRGHEDAAAHAEQEHQEQNCAEARRARQGKECDRDEGEAEDEAKLLAFVIDQRAGGERSEDQSERLRRSDGAVLAGREMEAIRQFGQDGAQHRGNHPVDEDGDNGGEHQHAAGVLSIASFTFRSQVREHRSSFVFDGSEARRRGWSVAAVRRQTAGTRA